MPGYPRWARAVTLPVSCYRVVRVEARAPFTRGRLVVQRRAPKKYQKASLAGARAVRLALGARCLPTVGSPLENSCWSRT